MVNKALIPAPVPTAGSSSKRERYRKLLAIDRDDLDEVLIQQPVLYADVCDGYADAMACRDACKLDLDEAQAKFGLVIREEALRQKEKLTEAHLEHCLAQVPEIMDLQRELLQWKSEVAHWTGLRDSFQQRKEMLEKEVPMYLSRLYGANSMSAPRQDLADANRAAAGQERIRRRKLTGEI